MMYLRPQPGGGRVALFGRDVAGLSRREAPLLRRRIGVVFQDFRLLDHLTERENVALPLRIGGQSGARDDKARRGKEVEELLAWVGLADHMDAQQQTLSGRPAGRESVRQGKSRA